MDTEEKCVVAIRLEDKSCWEKRAPLVPSDVALLGSDPRLGFLVEPSEIRVFSDSAYQQAGAVLASDLSPAKLILAVKEVPVEKLLAGKAYVFFAHVIKGQSYNMPLLRRLLELRCTLIDYERIADTRGRRLVLFGRQAGQAGMIDTFWALGRRWALAGHDTPFAELRQAYRYDDAEDAKRHLAAVGERLGAGIAAELAPFVVGVAGRGHVSRGAQEIIDLLPHEVIAPEDLPALRRRSPAVRDRLFKVVFGKRHIAEPRAAGGVFDATEYRRYPRRYRSRFIEYLPHLTVLVNGVYWTPAHPRLFTCQQAAELWRSGFHKLEVIGDITCDIDGAIEMTHKTTQPDAPTFVYDPIEGSWTDGLAGRGIVVLAVDNLPCELPRDASLQFSSALRQFIPAMAMANYDCPFSALQLPPEIRRAVITHRGELTDRYQYLQEHLDAL